MKLDFQQRREAEKTIESLTDDKIEELVFENIGLKSLNKEMFKTLQYAYNEISGKLKPIQYTQLKGILSVAIFNAKEFQDE